MNERLSPSGKIIAATREDSVATATIAANTTNDTTTAVTGLATTDYLGTTPQGAAASGLTWCAFCTTAGVLTIRRANVLATAITPATTTYITRIEARALPS